MVAQVLMPLHGLGGRNDLPVPVWVALYAALGALVFSFLTLGLLWRDGRFGRHQGQRLPEMLQRMAGERSASVCQSAMLVLTVTAVAVAWFGPADSASNPAPTWLYVWVWVGLVPASLLLGPVWKHINPARALADLLARPLRRRQLRMVRAGAGRWPAVGTLVAFLWLELVYDRSDDPRVVGTFVATMLLMHGLGGAVVGPEWFDSADGFEAYSSAIGRLAPWGRDATGYLVLRNPLSGLATMPMPPGQLGLLCTLLGSTAFDGITRTSLWSDTVAGLTRPARLAAGSLGLAAAILLVAAAYQIAMRATHRFSRYDGGTSRAYAHTLVPLIVGYAIAHYFSFGVFQGQAGVILASDPFGMGWNLFGTSAWHIDYLLVSTQTIAIVQLGAVVLGHVVGAVAAHDRSLYELRETHHLVGQLPYLLLMVCLTSVGLVLLMGL